MSGRLCAFWVALIVLLDQYTKQLVLTHFELGESIDIVAGLFALTSVRNRGGAFGLLSTLPEAWRVAFFVVFALGTMGALIWMLAQTKREDRWMRIALTGVIGGALGNLIDRVRFGEVVDFLDVYVNDWHWPTFNVADSFITCGLIVLLLVTARSQEPTEESAGE